MGSPRRFSVTLGIMPSYTSFKRVWEIDGISKSDGPSKADMKKGDVIKSINNKPISNIYEYMDRLASKIGNDCSVNCREK